MDEWIVERTVCTHNHPSRFWETSVLSPISGLVATSSSDSEEGSKQLAHLIAAAPELLEALKFANQNSRLYEGHPGRWADLIAKAEGKPHV